MKELSVEEKAKRYDEIIKKANKMHHENCEACQMCIEELIPELKEASEDERIRKAIHIYLNWLDGRKDYAPKGEYSIRDMIVWLKEQGEQKPIIEMKSAEESLGIDSETYNKIVDECIYGDDKSTCGKQGAQKPAWSEEDDKMLQVAISDTFDRAHLSVSDWLKSLKDRVQSQPKQEWWEEDERHIDTITRLLEDRKKEQTDLGVEVLDEEIAWLKSLRPQSTWKPSEEQMAVLNEVINYAANSDLQHWSSFIYTLLKSLREQLKKLKQ